MLTDRLHYIVPDRKGQCLRICMIIKQLIAFLLMTIQGNEKPLFIFISRSYINRVTYRGLLIGEIYEVTIFFEF